MGGPIHLSTEDIELLKNLRSGFYEKLPGDPAWERLIAAGLVAVSQPPAPPIQITMRGQRFMEGRH